MGNYLCPKLHAVRSTQCGQGHPLNEPMVDNWTSTQEANIVGNWTSTQDASMVGIHSRSKHGGQLGIHSRRNHSGHPLKMQALCAFTHPLGDHESKDGRFLQKQWQAVEALDTCICVFVKIQTDTNKWSEARAKSVWEEKALVATGGGWPRARAPKWYAAKLCHALYQGPVPCHASSLPCW